MTFPRNRTLQGQRAQRWIIVAIILALVLLRTYNRLETPTVRPVEGEVVQVRRVVDGDTLLLENGDRVRLLGVDTPETNIPDTPPEPFGPEASRFTERFVRGKEIRLEYDRERFDQYDRILAFVYADDQLLNEALIREGLSAAQLQYPYRSDMKTRFRKAQEEAQLLNRGIWALKQN